MIPHMYGIGFNKDSSHSFSTEPTKMAKELYEVFNAQSPFDNPDACSGCHVQCSRRQNARWLLDAEVPHLKGVLPVVEIKGASFFEGGSCPQFSGTGCKVYEKRPLECRLNPLSVYEIDGKLYWILYGICPRVGREGEAFIKKLLSLADKMEPHFTEEIKENFRRISRAIKTFDPFKEDEFRVLREIR